MCQQIRRAHLIHKLLVIHPASQVFKGFRLQEKKMGSHNPIIQRNGWQIYER
jgi:hypothetical protein